MFVWAKISEAHLKGQSTLDFSGVTSNISGELATKDLSFTSSGGTVTVRSSATSSSPTTAASRG